MSTPKSIGLAAMFCWLLAACAGQLPHTTGGGAGSALNRIIAAGELKVGCSADMPPLNMKTRDGKLFGMEIELAELIADALGVKPAFVAMPFGELLPALRTGKIDLILSAMAMTAKRNLEVAFVGPYYLSGKALLTRFKTVAAVRNPAELNDPRTKLSALKGSSSQQFAGDFMPEAMLYATADYQQAIQLVLDGTVDAMLADYPICVAALLRHPDGGLIPLITPLTHEPIGIALPAADPLFINWLQNYLKYLEDTRVLDGMRERWFSQGAWLQQLP